jgi:hypothetical protein
MPQQGYYAYIIGEDGNIRDRVVLCEDDKEAKDPPCS